MIIQEINATVNGNSLSGEVIVPSPVLTSTKQAEDGDLTKSPNFQLKLTGATPDMNIIDTVQVEFTNGDFNYTANLNVINTLQNGTVILQYVDGLTVEEVEHTFECAVTEIETHRDLTSGDVEGATTYFMYDGTAVPAEDIIFASMNYHNITVGEPTSNDITLTPKTTFHEITTGEFIDTLTATYKGITATVQVTLTITEEATEKLTMDIPNPSGNPYSMDYDSGPQMPVMNLPITLDEITLGVTDINGYTIVVDTLGTMGFPLIPQEICDYLTPTNISGNDHCSLSWEMGGFYVTSSDNSSWSDDITVEFELNDSNSSCTILGDEWAGNYSSFEEFVATLPESIQPYVTNNAENRPELPLSVWNGCTANVYFTVEFNGAPDIYYIYAGNVTHATVIYAEAVGISEGQTETFNIIPDSGYVLNTLVVEGDTTGNTINTTDLGNGEYSFIMPAEDVNIHVDCVIDERPPYFSSPANGDTLTGTLNSDSNYEYKYPLEICYGDGTPIPNNLIVDYTTVDNNTNWTIRHDTTDDGNGSYISNVYLYFNAGGAGDVTLIYNDAREGLYASATFHYEIDEDN